MPGFDRTGPFRTGPVGRGMGPCGRGQAGGGRGHGFSRAGFGWGLGQFAAPMLDQKELLEQRKNRLENQLAAISQCLKELEEKVEE